MLHIFNRELDGQAYKSPRVACSFRKSTATEISDETTFIDWAIINNENLIKYQLPKIDKTAVKKALQNGELVEGASLVEKLNLSIK